jgi:hypothetical protein
MLSSAERKEWMWHKKWSLPKITVRIARAPQPAVRHERIVVVLTAVALSDDGTPPEDVGLRGKRQYTVELGACGTAVVSFSNVFLKYTSYHCGGKRFRFAVTLCPEPAGALAELTPTSKEAPTPPPPLHPIACSHSVPFHIDARKRCKSERPLANSNDVRCHELDLRPPHKARLTRPASHARLTRPPHKPAS